MLTRTQMERAIAEGGSVLYGGRIITRVEQLPSEADLAQGNPEQEARAAEALDAQIAALQAQRERLGQASTKPVQPGPTSAAPAAAGGSATTEQSLDETVGEEQADRLRAAGYDTPDAVARASDEELLAIDGVGPATLKKLRAAYGKQA